MVYIILFSTSNLFSDTSLPNKTMLATEKLELQNYLLKLNILKLERELNIPRSKYTKNLESMNEIEEEITLICSEEELENS